MLNFIEGGYKFSCITGSSFIIDSKGFAYILDDKDEWRRHSSFGVPSKRGFYVEYEGECYLMHEEPCFYS